MKKLLAIIIFAVMLFAFAVTASAAETVTLNAPLDFTAETLPAPGENDLWSYEEATKTLTLKDGLNLTFSGFAEGLNAAIILPDGATVVVEGSAAISSEHDCILGMGDLDIKFATAEATLKLYVGEHDSIGYEDDYAITAKGDLSITAPEDLEGSGMALLDIDSENICIYVYEGSVTFENICITFLSEADGICVLNNYEYEAYKEAGISFPVTLTNVMGTIDTESNSGIDGIYSDFGGIYLTDCNISFDTNDESLETYIGDIIITDSTLDIIADEEAFETSWGDVKIINSTVTVDTTTDEEGISISESGNCYITESTVTLDTDEDGIEINGDIIITDSTVTIATDSYEGLDANYTYDENYDYTDEGGNITITGSTVTIDVAANGDAIYAAENLTITESDFDIEVLNPIVVEDEYTYHYFLFTVYGTITIDEYVVLESEGTEIYRDKYSSSLEVLINDIDTSWDYGTAKTLGVVGEDGTITEAHRIYSDEHTHEYNIPKYDDENHWDECECGDKINVEPHTHEPKQDDDNHWEECECGHKINEQAHTHEPKFDDNNHWEECECGHIINEELHTHEPKQDDDNHWEECECGHVINKEPHDHKLGWDENSHWYGCECGHKINLEEHSFEWIVDKKAQDGLSGWGHYECSHCKYKQAPVEIPFTGTLPRPSLEGVDHEEEQNPNTGAPVIAPFVIVSLIGIAVFGKHK